MAPVDGEYLLDLSSNYPDSPAPVYRPIYCHGMESCGTPQPFLTLQAPTDQNYAYVAPERAHSISGDNCRSDHDRLIYKNHGLVNYTKVKLIWEVRTIYINIPHCM